MPTLVTAADVQTRFDISPDISGARIEPHVGSASRRLRRWVGEAAYSAAIAGTNAEMAEDLKNAEAHLAFHFLVYGVNSPMTTKGIVSTAMSPEGKEIRKYLSPDETQKVARHMLELAREIAEPYLLHDGTPDAGIALVSCDE